MRDFTGTTGRCFLFCNFSKQADINEIYKDIDFDSGGDKTMSIPLQEKNQPLEAQSHWGANTVVDAEMDLDIKGAAPTLTRYFSEDGWTWETALDDMWLQVIEEVVA